MNMFSIINKSPQPVAQSSSATYVADLVINFEPLGHLFLLCLSLLIYEPYMVILLFLKSALKARAENILVALSIYLMNICLEKINLLHHSVGASVTLEI